MNIKEWIEVCERSGMVCPEYMRKLAATESREDVFRVLCDVNGGSWLFGLHARGVPLPVDGFKEEYGGFINGGRVVTYPKGYTSKFYCRLLGEHSGGVPNTVVADTTLVYLLECKSVFVEVPANAYPSVILSAGSTANIVLHPSARLNVEMYGDAVYRLSGDQTRVNVKRH